MIALNNQKRQMKGTINLKDRKEMRIIFIYSRVFYDHDIMLLYYLFG